MPNSTLYLIDGYAQFFRAYHAIRTPMTSPVTGEPTNMSYGFVGMLLKLLRAQGEHLRGDGSPAYVALALDVSGDTGTFRSQLYPEYKANRDAPPEDLRPQVDRCLALLGAIGVPVLGAEGFEADDVIATVATALGAQSPDVRMRIVSKDKDLKQLLSGGEIRQPVEMYDIHKDELITAASMHEDQGIGPAQVVDMLALMGDTSDNVPGVPGIGAKTAAKLMAEFGTLDAVVEAAESGEIKGKRGENIRASGEVLALSKELVTLRRDTPVELDLEAARVDGLKLGALGPILLELGFNRYQDDLKTLMTRGASDRTEEGTQGFQSLGLGAESGSALGGFGSLFEQTGDDAARAPVDGDYHLVRTEEELDALTERMRAAPVVAVDTETTALRPMRAELAGISVSVKEGEAYYIPVRSPEPGTHLDEQTVLGKLRSVLENESIPKVGHNIKYDLIVLRRAGVSLRGFVPADAESPGGDSMIASYLIDASRSSHSMDALALALLGRVNVPIKELIGSGKNQRRFDEVELERAGPYAAEDADVTLRLHEAERAEIREMGLGELYRAIEMPLVEVLAELEFNGIVVDREELGRQRERLEAQISDLKSQIDDVAMDSIGRVFEINSPKQLSGVLFNKTDAEEPGLGLKPGKRTKTGYSTDAGVLEKLVQDASVESPIPRLVLDYRQLSKLVGTYLKALVEEIHPQTGRVHASFNQTVAVTGRLSSSDPNLQNIPIRTEVGREIRKAFVAPAGRVLVSADYSQIELRLLAHLSRDEAMIAAFRAGEDIHAAVAAQVHGVALDEVTREMRSGAKMVNFGIVYGITAFGLARRLGISNGEAGTIIEGYKARFTGINRFLGECVGKAERDGFVETMCGRRRPIVDIGSNNPNRRALGERTAINSVVQGSAADLIKIAMVDLHRRIVSGEPGMEDVQMLLQIHDELVFEVPEGSAEAARDVIVERMEAAMELSVPLVVDATIGRDWYKV